MRSRLLSAALVAAALAFPAVAKDLPSDAPLVQDGPVKIDAADFQAAMRRVPKEMRPEFRTSYDRVVAMVDNIYVARSLAEKARELGLDKDPVVQRQLQQAQDAVLADLYLEHLGQNAPKIDYEARAKELYEADPSSYVRPEAVNLQTILISLNGRTRDMALKRAQQVYEEAKSGKEDFLQLAARYSDDHDKVRNGGDLGWNSPKSFVAPVSRWLEEPHEKGEISPPIESEYGFHIIRFVDRRKAEPIPFAEVKNRIIRAERDRLVKQRREEAVQAVRSSKTVVTNVDNIQALVVPSEAILSKPVPSPKTAPAGSAAPAAAPASPAGK